MSVGKSKPRKDAWIKANGEAQYNFDIHYSNELRLHVIRSPHAHAKIKDIHIDIAQINRLNATIGTSKDIPGKNVVREIFDDLPLLAEKTVKYVGQPVAIVLAKTQQKTHQAASSIRIEYEPLPAVFNPLEAKNHPTIQIFRDNNISSSWTQNKGNLDEGFTEAEKSLLKKLLLKNLLQLLFPVCSL